VNPIDPNSGNSVPGEWETWIDGTFGSGFIGLFSWFWLIVESKELISG